MDIIRFKCPTPRDVVCVTESARWRRGDDLTHRLVPRRRGLRGPKNWLARIMHNIVVTLLLTDSHADTPWRLSDMFPRLLAGAARHREHHATGGPPYQQFFGFMDAAFSPPPTPAKKVV